MGGVLEFEDPALLRAARVADVLRGCGRLLASSDGSAGAYELSSQAEWIDVFISHNWGLGRWRKFAALAMHFNLEIACCAAVAALVPAAYLASVAARVHARLAEVCPIVSGATVLAFLAALFFGQEVRAALGCRGQRAFLDKACIHQADDRLKERGIRSLGAFLHRSDSMVVCFTGLYLKRLWTVYEFATFLLVRGASCPGAIHIMPANLPPLVLAASACGFCNNALWRVLPLVTGQRVVVNALAFAALQCILLAGGRWWARQQDEARTLFEHFALERAACSSESDRALVCGNVIALMRRFSHVGVEPSDADVLQAFDDFVRSAGPRAFRGSVGAVGVSYRLLLPALLTQVSNEIHYFTLACVHASPGFTTTAQIAFQLISLLASCFTTIPLAVAIMLHLLKRCLALRGALDVAYCATVGLLVSAIVLTFDPGNGKLRPWLLDAALDRSAPLPFLLYSAALFVVTAVVYRQPRWEMPTTAGLDAAEVGAAADSPRSAGAALEVAKTETSTRAEDISEVAKTETSRSAEHPCEADDLHSETHLQVTTAHQFGRIIGSKFVVQLGEP